MKPIQASLELDFTIPAGISKRFRLHKKENNDASQKMLNENKKKFTRQCETVYNLLKKGIRLTRKSAMIEYNIMSLERRIADLIENKIEIKKEWVTDEKGRKIFIEYYL